MVHPNCRTFTFKHTNVMRLNCHTTSFVGPSNVLEQPPEGHGCADAHEVGLCVRGHPAGVAVVTHLTVSHTHRRWVRGGGLDGKRPPLAVLTSYSSVLQTSWYSRHSLDSVQKLVLVLGLEIKKY